MPGAPSAPRAGGPCWAPLRPAPHPCRLPGSFPGLASSALAPGPGALSETRSARLLCINLSACAWRLFLSYPAPAPAPQSPVPAPLSALLTELPSFSSSGSPGARLLLRWFRGVSRYVTPSHEGRGAASPYGEVFSGALDFESRGF